MFHAFLTMLPFALAAAVSPMMFTEQTLVLSSAGRKAAIRYALSAAAVMLVWVSVLVLFGRVISLPKEPTLSANLDIVLGVLLLVIAYILGRTGLLPKRKKKEKKPKDESKNLSASGAYAFGAFSMATNFTSLALVIPAAKDIASSSSELPERAILILIVTLIVAVPAWLPIVLTAVAPGTTRKILKFISEVITKHGRIITRVLLLALGLYLIAKGVIHHL